MKLIIDGVGEFNATDWTLLGGIAVCLAIGFGAAFYTLFSVGVRK